MTKRRIVKNVLIISGGPNGGSPNIKNICEAEKDRPEPTWKLVYQKLLDVKVAILAMNMEIENYKTGGVSITEPPVILGDREFFQAPGDPQGE